MCLGQVDLIILRVHSPKRNTLPPDNVDNIEGSCVVDEGGDRQKRQGAPSSGKSNCDTCSICFSSGAGLSAELLLEGRRRPGGGSRELGGMIISGINKVSGGSRVSCVVVLKRPPLLTLLLAVRRPPRMLTVEEKDPCAAREVP